MRASIEEAERRIGEPGTSGPAYVRDRLLALLGLEILLLRWRPDVPSAVHDHGGAHGEVLLLAGTLRESFYASDGTTRLATRVHRAPARIAIGASDLHAMEALGGPATSLHVYRAGSRPMRIFDPTRARFVSVRSGTGAFVPVDPATIVEEHG